MQPIKFCSLGSVTQRERQEMMLLTRSLCVILAAVFGDPHFITFDGVQYSFNGKGEYTLLASEKEKLTIQGRTEPVNCKRATF